MTKSPEARQPGSDPPLAYRNHEFLDSDDARPIRILAEYMQPLQIFARERVHHTLVFFGSARIREDGPLRRYYAEARELARLATRWSLELDAKAPPFVVVTGGGPGVMEAANRGARDAGGRTIGLNIGLPHEQRPNPWITPELSFEFHYFFMRKLWFAHLASALIVFPGGFGTLDELFEMLTLSQTRKLAGPLQILLYGTDYWNEIVNFKAMAEHGVISSSDLELFRFVDSPGEALDVLREKLAVSALADRPRFSKSATRAEVGR